MLSRWLTVTLNDQTRSDPGAADIANFERASGITCWGRYKPAGVIGPLSRPARAGHTAISKIMRQVPCPRCKAICLFEPSNPFRPFCSEQCKHMDWGAWAMEAYRVAAPPDQDDGAQAGEGFANKDLS